MSADAFVRMQEALHQVRSASLVAFAVSPPRLRKLRRTARPTVGAFVRTRKHWERCAAGGFRGVTTTPTEGEGGPPRPLGSRLLVHVLSWRRIHRGASPQQAAGFERQQAAAVRGLRRLGRRCEAKRSRLVLLRAGGSAVPAIKKPRRETGRALKGTSGWSAWRQ